jgi:dynein heavy chain
MEIKFELMKRTLNLLKKYKRFDVVDLEAKFNSTPIRWTNLKSKVTLAKQRLGPTIQEESQSIMEDLKDFSSIINNLLSDILKSSLFSHQCDENKALQKLDEFTARWERLQKEAEDLKQLQELLDANVVDFSQLINARHTIHCLKQAWKTIKFDY